MVGVLHRQWVVVPLVLKLNMKCLVNASVMRVTQDLIALSSLALQAQLGLILRQV
jgi:hypothetical protein